MKRFEKVLAWGAFLAVGIPFLGQGALGLYFSSKYISPPWGNVLLGLIFLCVVGFGWQAVRAYRRRAKDFKENKKAAAEGGVEAQNLLGVKYYMGDGVEQDFKEGAKWFRKAADQGNALAQANLGVMYGEGQWVEKNCVIAYAQSRIATANGVEIAKETTSIIAKEMTPAQIAEAGELVKEMVEKNPNLINK